MKTVQRSRFKSNPLVAKLVLAATSIFAAGVAYGNAGYGVNTDISGATIPVPTYYANSPQGLQPALDPVTHLPIAGVDCNATPQNCVDTGTALRKFVDPLAAVDGNGNPAIAGKAGIPLAITAKWFNPLTNTQTADDYYEIAIVQYTQQMHSDLAKPTILRGYVQVETPAIVAGLADAAGVKSEHIALMYPDGKTPVLDANKNQVYAVHKPYYLGPIIIAQKGTAVRIKYYNYLPYGSLSDAANPPVGYTTGGELPIPVDTYLAGGGPAVDKNGNPIQYTQNRADVHWHGGDTPWISDGTPHQWIAPAGEANAYLYGIGRGQSANNVPDMPDPGAGAGTLYFPNNLSARLMFYHDHTSGLTRLNVYEGIAAGYVVQDPVEQDLVGKGIIPKTLLGAGIPLVIQDKTFVPKNIGPNATANNGGIQSQDAKWDLNHWGQPGDLWFPHVYETNQDPNSIDGTNPVGRWDWGPWFWPVFPSQYSLPSGNYGDVTTTPEAFMDTPIVNGQAYPTMTVDPIATRFRILHVPNDRSGNYNFFEAVDAAGNICVAGTTPAANTNAPGQTGALATCTEVRMVPAAATAGYPATWPTDARAGGVPDPTTAGPDIIQIGNEAGFLPAPAVWPAQPVTYDQNVRSMTVFNVLNHALLMGGAERADVIVDFSKFAGKTLILYNDAPAPMPGFDPRIDYFTGDGDQTIGGGAYNTLAGYGPNTRTVMQIVVNPTVTGTAANSVVGATATPFNLPALQAAMPVAYAASQPAPNVPESVYNTAFGTNNTDNYARIFSGSNTQPEFSFSAPGYMISAGQGAAIVNTTGVGYTSVPTVTINGLLPTIVNTSQYTDSTGVVVTVGSNGPAAGATAHAILSGGTTGTVTGIVIDSVGAGYLTKPTIMISGGGASVQATATLTSFPTQVVSTVHIINKAIQELFDPVYGRMNATLAVELPYSSSQVATTIPLAYIDAPIDNMDGIKDGETQIWKITHNGVDSHPVHFHLVNVQVLNRVDWAGVVKPPQANEVGWKEVLRMNPLEDVYVAVRAVHPVVPFGLPRSQRTLDPSQAVTSQTGFTQIDQMTGNAPTFQTQLVSQVINGVTQNVTQALATGAYGNQLTDFDNEYVWHCHILGHEENDFMRPFIFHPNVVTPDEPGSVKVSLPTITWVDPTPAGGQDSNGVPTAGINANYPTPTSSPKNEVGFRIQQPITTTVTTATPATSTTYTLTSLIVTGLKAGAGYTSTPTVKVSGTVTSGTAPTAKATITAGKLTAVTLTGNLGAVYSSQPTLTFTGGGGGRGFTQGSASLSTASTTVVINGQYNKGTSKSTGSTTVVIVPANTTTYTDAAGQFGANGSTSKAVVTYDAAGDQITTSVKYGTLTVIAFNSAQVPQTVTNCTRGGRGQPPTCVTTPVIDPLSNVPLYQYAGDSTTAAQLSTAVDGTNAAAATATLTTADATLINNAANTSAVTGPSAPTGLTQTVDASGNVILSWTAVPGATGYMVTYGNPAQIASIVTVAPATAPVTTFTIPAAQANATASVVAVMANGTQVLTSAASSSVYNGVAYPPVGFTATPGAAGSGSIALTWANDARNVNNVTGFTLTWAGGTATFAPTSAGVTVGEVVAGSTTAALTSGTSYTFSLTTNGSAGNSVAPVTATAVAP